MKYTDHKGKLKRVSDKRFREFASREENEPVWLVFRVKQFGFSKEELIMNPSPRIIFGGKYGGLRTVQQFKGKFHGGYYSKGNLSDILFDTPEEAYDFAYNLL